MNATPRRSARNQPIPDEEAEYLRDLRGNRLYARAKQLFEAGWTLASIGRAFEPPKSRTTVQNWVQNGDSEAFSPSLPPVRTPEYATDPEYVKKRPTSPGIPSTDLDTLQTLAPVARKYRASMNPGHPAQIANENLTKLCQHLRETGVSVQELADATGVTYRAMARRLGK